MPNKKTPPKQFTITEAAKRLKVTRAAIHDAIKQGRLKAKWGVAIRVVKQKALMIPEQSLKQYAVNRFQQQRARKKTA
jgi:excisionase family DNA binding protein